MTDMAAGKAYNGICRELCIRALKLELWRMLIAMKTTKTVNSTFIHCYKFDEVTIQCLDLPPSQMRRSKGTAITRYDPPQI